MMASSKAMRDAVKKLAGNTDGAVSQFSEPDLLDDLLDHWTSAEHVAERQALVRRLQVRGWGWRGLWSGRWGGQALVHRLQVRQGRGVWGWRGL
jgi:hypothetical protein